MIRVGFIADGRTNEWLGGVNYLLNLLHAISSLPEPKIEPVVFVSPNTPEEFIRSLPPIEIIQTKIVDNSLKLNYIRKAARDVLGRDFVLERFLNRHRIDVISHSRHIGSRARIPSISWIPDFQHRRLPSFFQANELRRRDKQFKFACKYASMIVVSSFDAQRDLAEFDSCAVRKSRVLHFVSGFGAANKSIISIDELRARYDFESPYFFLPNQFWVHKNQRLVIEALGILKRRGQKSLVLATGNVRDRRQPDYFEALMVCAKENEVEESFRVLGIVPYDDIVALMRNSIAVINPSLFEGWSTSVEEAKSMGKSVLLSDIPTHREQAPEWGTIFPANSPEELADTIECASKTYSPATDADRMARARELLPSRIREFASAYEGIVLECVEAYSNSAAEFRSAKSFDHESQNGTLGH